MITADRDALRRDFPLKPFAIRHKLAGHPLLTLPRIAQLAAELPRDLIEYNSGKVAISQDPDAIPSVDLDPVEVVKSIEDRRRLDGAQARGEFARVSPRCWRTPCCRSRARAASTACSTPASSRSRVFCSCPRRTRPRRSISTARTISSSTSTAKSSSRSSTIPTARSSSDDEIERSMTKHRNLKYDESFAPRGTEFHLFAGDGCYVPYQWPHWVRTAGSFSISMAITWKTREVRRLNDLHFFNSMLRGIGLPQQPPGKQPLRDALKLAFYRTRDDGHQAAARLDGDAPRAAADRAGQAGELLSEGA